MGATWQSGEGTVWLTLASLLAAALAGGVFWYHSIHGWKPASDPNDEFGLEFRYLGCDDWPEARPYEPSIRSESAGPGITYRISDPATCGYSVKLAEYALVGGDLKLSYVLHSPTGEVAACICEYKSEFRFRTDPRASRVEYSHSGG